MKCDIIIPVWNEPQLTRECIQSIFRNTVGEYRVIIIDNASSDETARYLKQAAAADRRLLVIHNDKNEGFIKAVNRGIRFSDAPLICLLNNDTIVTKNWLSDMISVALSDNKIGLVNPSSNNLGQRPGEGESIDQFAERLRAQSGKYVELGAAIGFCMLIKREVIQKIGLLDEIYGIGNFEDTDFSRRAAREGYRAVRACGAYVYHCENTSFIKIKTFSEDFKRNREIFEFRWGKPKRIAYILDSVDHLEMQKIDADAIKAARSGNWVTYFSSKDLTVPEHSNIKLVRIPAKFFHPRVIFKVLTKKKKFKEVFTGDAMVGRVLKALSFIHKAEIKYY